jgi:hypothetical protein
MFPEFFDIEALVNRESYRLDRVLLTTSTCTFRRRNVSTSGRQGQWFLLHYTAPSHNTSLVVKHFLAEKIILFVDLSIVRYSKSHKT